MFSNNGMNSVLNPPRYRVDSRLRGNDGLFRLNPVVRLPRFARNDDLLDCHVAPLLASDESVRFSVLQSVRNGYNGRA